MSRSTEETAAYVSLDGVAVLIPALNEEDALPGVLQSIRTTGVTRVTVVDNGSSDGTAAVAEEHGARVVLEPERGYGAACLAGIADLQQDDEPPRIVVFLDGDGSDDPSEISRLVRPIGEGRAGLVIGIRPSVGSAVPLHARLGNRMILGLTRLLHGARFRDLGPFRAIGFPELLGLEMDDRTWGWTLQMQLRAYRRGLRVEEVEVAHRPRSAGRSKISGSLAGSLRAGVKMLFTVVKERVRGSREGPARR